MEESFYNIKTNVFEGPLDVLLSLIEKRKLFISDISLSKVADDYIAYIKSFEDFPIDHASEFILVASTLMLIKSRSLLPNLSLSDEEEQSITELEDQLKLHKKYKDLSLNIKKLFGENMIFQKIQNKNDLIVFSPDKNVTKDKMLYFIKNVLNNMLKVENLPKAIVKKVISLEEAIVSLSERMSSAMKMSFKNFSGIGKQEKVLVIVNFLAMLELVKQGVIRVKQEINFDDIEMETNIISVPKY